MFSRWVEPLWKKKLAAPYAHLVFGARQTGKTTLLRKLLPQATVWLVLSGPGERAEYWPAASSITCAPRRARRWISSSPAQVGSPPIEVKWTEHPTASDARHVLTFLGEHPKRARHGYVICRCAAPLALTDRVTALPWSLI
jgi:hypothetical protein